MCSSLGLLGLLLSAAVAAVTANGEPDSFLEVSYTQAPLDVLTPEDCKRLFLEGSPNKIFFGPSWDDDRHFLASLGGSVKTKAICERRRRVDKNTKDTLIMDGSIPVETFFYSPVFIKGKAVFRMTADTGMKSWQGVFELSEETEDEEEKPNQFDPSM